MYFSKFLKKCFISQIPAYFSSGDRFVESYCFALYLYTALDIDKFKCFWLEEIRVERQSDCGEWWMGIPLLLWILQQALYIKETIWKLDTLE